MANAVEEALNRASTGQRERAMQIIEEARRNIQTANVTMGDISSTDAASVARNAQVLEEAKRTIPFETMQHVDSVSPPMQTPPMHGISNSNLINLHPDVQSNIESIQQSGGNNYLNENAMDRAMTREAQPAPQYEPQHQQAMSR